MWQVLSGVKNEFGKFGTVLEKVQKKLQEASNTVGQATVRSRAVQRKLREVHELPVADAIHLSVSADCEIDGEGDDEEQQSRILIPARASGTKLPRRFTSAAPTPSLAATPSRSSAAPPD